MHIPTHYNKIQVNYSTEQASDGSVIRTSLMVNIHADDVDEAVELYREMKQQLEGSASHSASPKVESFPDCPEHKIKMVMRTRKSDGGVFFGCPMYQREGCQRTSQFPVRKKGSAKTLLLEHPSFSRPAIFNHQPGRSLPTNHAYGV